MSVRIEDSVFSFRISGTAGRKEKCGSFRGGCCSILFTIILNLPHALSFGQMVDSGSGASFATFKPIAICQVKQINDGRRQFLKKFDIKRVDKDQIMSLKGIQISTKPAFLGIAGCVVFL